ncbi:hypothetical protein [Lignipirellula cremea]|uniref:Verru_Chthon cassette protein A n=1 Tax=Lignipirellula cremea TaxID=2528010 RepID=A0A518DMH6_9BACT|nr:hypothetical protein [Lignipirellula cremea]QDU93039.1 hypothetical protein Pla8534_08140 [Lignipirellula cremea]
MRSSFARRQKRGIVLLVVLSLLALFMVLVTTFLIGATLYYDGAVSRAKVDRIGDSPQTNLDRAMYQVLRGPSGSNSSLIGHSLLEDLYGNDGGGFLVASTMQTAAPSNVIGNGQFWIIPLARVSATSAVIPDIPNVFAGRVATLLDGPNRNVSFRVLGSAPVAFTGTASVPAGPWILVERPQSDVASSALPQMNDRIIINGAPFNGSGAGWRLGTGNVDRVTTLSDSSNAPIALMPHYATYFSGAGRLANDGGADESYDAADYQNMWLAMIPPGVTASNQIEPSFHRTSLIRHWSQLNPTLWRSTTTNDLRRRVIMRPMGWDHPGFTGSNPFMDCSNLTPAGIDAVTNTLINGPWDVDNDRDGLAESIWLDIGLPVQSKADGKLYKPLAAILIQDLDGRLNVNAHGNNAHFSVFNGTDHTNTYYEVDPTTGQLTSSRRLRQVQGPLAGTSGPVNVSRGAGYGPADVSLLPLFSSLTNYQNVVSQRYLDSVTGLTEAGDSNAYDGVGRLDELGLPATFSAASGVSNYGTPPDVWGVNAITVDYRGQQLVEGETNAAIKHSQNTVDDPYELDLSSSAAFGSPTGSDHPYTLAELERLLRFNDYDGPILPSRLLFNANGDLNSAAKRAQVTTESRSLPVANVQFQSEVRANQSASPTIADLFLERIIANGVTNTTTQLQLLEKLVPLELRRGELFDVNRPLGNGRDDNGNGVVDEPAEATGELVWDYSTEPLPGSMANFQNISFNHNTGEPVALNTKFARQNYARHLYTMMMLLVRKGYNFPRTEGAVSAAELTAQRCAQWAINAVDFRDADSIMTPFEYDVNPFNGWDAMDGDPASDEGNERRIVWGSEQPELTMTEFLAFHDRRVKDTDWDTTGKKRQKMDAMAPGGWAEDDDDLDQYRMPQGSLFIEMQCMRNFNTNNPNLPAELYNLATGTLDLTRVSPDDIDGGRANIQQAPVWRIAISEMNTANHPHDEPLIHPDSSSFGMADTSVGHPFGRLNMNGVQGEAARYVDLDRVIYFTNSTHGYTAAELHAWGVEVFYNYNNQANFGPAPGQYAVIGPRSITHMGSTAAPLAPMGTDSIRTFQLGPAGITFNGLTADNASPNATQAAPAVGMVAAAAHPATWAAGAGGAGDPTNAEVAPEGIGLNISEPRPNSGNYYGKPNYQVVTGAPYDGFFDTTTMGNTVPDRPFDDRGTAPIQAMQNTGTYTKVRAAFLQRLADPTIAWHRLRNPYITVDWGTIDLTVFNGQDDEKATDWMVQAPAVFDPQGGDPDTAGGADGASVQQYSRERGTGGGAAPDPWNPRAGWNGADQHYSSRAGAIATENQIYWRRPVRHTLGFLNTTMGNVRTNANTYTTTELATLGQPLQYAGTTKVPFPWLTWNNRPFNSAYELMMVPASSPSRLLSEFSTASTTNPYTLVGGVTGPEQFRAPYSHLLNFFYSEPTGTGSPQLHRLFDYVGTRSPFVGTNQWYSSTSGVTSNHLALSLFHPPFNRISKFRDPGKVNINTIYDFRTWSGIASGFPQHNSTAFWNTIETSREGFTGTTLTSANSPTRFAQPFRSSAAADLAPLPELETSAVQATLLRSNPGNPGAPLFAGTSTANYRDFQRNAFFAYEGISRLDNLLTTHSNVFAVWVTIGEFEATPNAALHGGFQLGAEAGSDSGQVTRHRAFYIIDRSIPVAFEPGENHNIDRAVLLRRYLD